jgi:anaerobic selenocysteine-containing dehydrogenase
MKMAAAGAAASAVGLSLSDSLVETDAAAAAESGDEVTKMVTSCHGCIQMCPMIAHLRDGVVVKIEGDPRAPVSRGSACMKALNQLHTMYSPRRVLHPLKRAGERGENKWEAISWDEALDLAADHIHEGIEKYGPYSFFASVGGGGSYSFMEAMTLPMAFGSPTVFEPGCAQCYLPRYATADFMYGGADQSIADNAVQEIFRPKEDNKAEVVVLWAAQPSVSQTAESGRGMAEIRAAGVKTIVVDSHFSPDAAKADVWLPVRPATDTGVLLSWFRYIFENKLYNEEFTKYWTNLPFLIDPDTKLPVLAKDVIDGFEQTTPEDTPAYVCYDLKTGSVQPFEYSLPKDSKVDPEIFWEGEYQGKTYKTAGQIYKEQAEPWTLEHTEEVCWTPADRNEAAIRLYTHADEDGTCYDHVSGIADGLASDMTESASQVPLGCLGLDAIMGYVNRPGATLTQKGASGYFTEYSDSGDAKIVRPKAYYNGFGGMFSDMYGIGAVVGMSDAQNEARIKELGEADGSQQELANQLLLDRIGMKDHKGLYTWCHSHIPSVREAIATGEPFKPRVWFDMSGNKLAVLGNAQSWYDVFPEVDYVIGQYPMLTSFHIEAADLVFPLREWLEEPMVNMTQLNTQWLQNECTHIGETVSHSIPAAQVIKRYQEKYGDLPGLKPGYLGNATEAEVKQSVADTLGAPDWDTLVANTDQYVPKVTPADEYFQYDQHLTEADDGLPMGFATESRKFEVYCTLLLKMARTGYPFCYPKPQEACDDYSPICEFIEPAESPTNDEANGEGGEYPFILTSGRVPYFHHGTMRHAAFARELFPTAQCQINPADASDLGIETNDWVKLTSRRGSTSARALVTEAVAPGTVWMERFWNPECYDASQAKQTGGWREENVNMLTKNDAPFNEVFGSYTNRGFTVKVEKGERPEGVWVEPKEFEPFMPTLQSEPRTEDVF